MEFRSFAAHAADVEAADADLDVVALVADLLRDAGDDLPVVTRFVQGRVFPAHAETKLDIGPRLCYEALARAASTNVSAADVEDALADTGDIGEVAASLDLGGQAGLGAFGSGGDGAGDDLTVAGVFDELSALAAAEGDGSQDEKVTLLFGQFNRCSSEEARYLARLVLGEMRIGVGEGTVRDAIAEAFEVPVEAVERALQVSNDYGLVAETARDDGEDGLDAMHLAVGRPVQAMLAQAGTVTDALDEWGEAAVETKFDGARVQVHWDGDDVALYSRNMEDVTGALPEIVEFVEREVDPPVILDGEAVAVADDGTPLAFQEILKRFRRKHDVEEMRDEVGVEFSAFDCLHAGVPESESDSGAGQTPSDGGEDLLDEPFRERHARLESVVGDDSAVADVLVTDDADEIAAFEAEALDSGHEGIMLKDPDAAYTPGDRGKHWLKRKPDVETLDLVVTGGEWGEGRRASFIGTFLLSARDESADSEFATIGKVATGITDEELADLTELIEPHVRAEDGQEIDVEPAVVFEVGYEEIQESPTYSSGYALRFPRFVTVREDKTPETADTLERVRRLADDQS